MFFLTVLFDDRTVATPGSKCVNSQPREASLNISLLSNYDVHCSTSICRTQNIMLPVHIPFACVLCSTRAFVGRFDLTMLVVSGEFLSSRSTLALYPASFRS